MCVYVFTQPHQYKHLKTKNWTSPEINICIKIKTEETENKKETTLLQSHKRHEGHCFHRKHLKLLTQRIIDFN